MMEITFAKTKKRRDDLTSKSKETNNIFSGENISNKESEVNLNKDNSSLNKLNNQFYAERELSGNYMYSISNTNPKEKKKIISKEDINS